MNPEQAFEKLCADQNHKDRESLERIISKDAEYSCLYAEQAIEGRFILGEDAISKDAFFSYEYACVVIGGRFHLGEAAISADAWCSSFYAIDVIGGRFELGEAAIIKDSELSYLYAKDVLRCIWTPELAVMCPCWLYTYAKDVIKGRLPSTMHNKMIVFGMIDSSDKYVKKYLGAKKYCTLKGIRATKQKKLKCKIQDRC